jgi:hypothetical protein
LWINKDLEWTLNAEDMYFLKESRITEISNSKWMLTLKQELIQHHSAVKQYLSENSSLISNLQSIVADYAAPVKYMKFRWHFTVKWIMIQLHNIDELCALGNFMNLIGLYNARYFRPRDAGVSANFDFESHETLFLRSVRDPNYKGHGFYNCMVDDVDDIDRLFVHSVLLNEVGYGPGIARWAKEHQESRFKHQKNVWCELDA